MFFHLTKNVWKKLQSVGLQERYIADQEFATHLRMIPALAFLPPQHVIDVFERLSDHIRQTYGADADEVLDYFEDTYIGRFRRNDLRAVPTFAIEMWNMFHRTAQEMPRTNNLIEGWHNKFQGMCTSYHPKLLEISRTTKKIAVS